MKGEVSIRALADLAGLGASQGPAIAWSVPAGFLRSAGPPSQVYPRTSPPSDSGDMRRHYGPVMLLLILALGVVLVSRRRASR